VVTADLGWLDTWLAEHHDELIAIRRQIHAKPELGRAEFATTKLVAERLAIAGMEPRLLPGTGLVCDIGNGAPVVALRADLDALPLADAKDAPYRSTVPGVCHACGHDVHTTVVLGAGLALAAMAESLPGRVRLVFQPAEELIPGGALDVIAADVLSDLSTIVALHCDPRLDVGRVGLRAGTITAASDSVEVFVDGPGGHTARPHLTVDLVDVLARIVVGVPAEVARRLDPHIPFAVVWGAVGAGAAANVIPSTGWLRGSVRTLDMAAWERAESVVSEAVHASVRDSGASLRIDYRRGVPPVVNDEKVIEVLRAGVTSALGSDAVTTTEPSMGGEDFGWYLQSVPGALARLGVRTHGSTGGDLHQATFDVDERAIDVGVRTLVGTALAALS
jgi:amidohydrolase